MELLAIISFVLGGVFIFLFGIGFIVNLITFDSPKSVLIFLGLAIVGALMFIVPMNHCGNLSAEYDAIQENYKVIYVPIEQHESGAVYYVDSNNDMTTLTGTDALVDREKTVVKITTRPKATYRGFNMSAVRKVELVNKTPDIKLYEHPIKKMNERTDSILEKLDRLEKAIEKKEVDTLEK
jgi:hypothetical protein